MALTKFIKTQHGFDASDCYIKVENVAIFQKTELSFDLVFKRSTIDPPFKTTSHSCSYDINGQNPIAQAYIYLKTLPEFVSATDI